MNCFAPGVISQCEMLSGRSNERERIYENKEKRNRGSDSGMDQ